VGVLVGKEVGKARALIEPEAGEGMRARVVSVEGVELAAPEAMVSAEVATGYEGQLGPGTKLRVVVGLT
jgi:hypothetical protein